ncbi:MAG: hypothetical protein LZ170_00025 [Thaumarchaeota archaeon]|nr:hypothetical protein [Candidatus Terraquivivens yellowstonensis]
MIKKVGLDIHDSNGLGYQLHIHFYRMQLERAWSIEDCYKRLDGSGNWA